MARNLDQPGANFNQLLELSMKLENARTFASKPNGVTTLTSDDWDIWLQQNDPNYQTLEEEELNAGGRVGYGEGGIDFYPYISGSKGNIPLEDEYNVDIQNLIYGGTLMGQKDNIFAGAEGIKIKNKINFMKENQTLFKDTTDDEKISFILGVGDPEGNKFQIKADKNLENILATLNLQFNKGGRVGYKDGKTVLPKAKPQDYAGTLKMLLSKEAWNTLDPRTWTDLTYDFAKKARDAGQFSDKTYQSLMMPLFGETGEKITESIS